MTEPPTNVTESDLLRYQLAESRAQQAATALELARERFAAMQRDVAQRYAIGPADTVRDTGEIVRAP